MLPSADTVEKANTIVDVLVAGGVSLVFGALVAGLVFGMVFGIRYVKRKLREDWK